MIRFFFLLSMGNKINRTIFVLSMDNKSRPFFAIYRYQDKQDLFQCAIKRVMIILLYFVSFR